MSVSWFNRKALKPERAQLNPESSNALISALPVLNRVLICALHLKGRGSDGLEVTLDPNVRRTLKRPGVGWLFGPCRMSKYWQNSLGLRDQHVHATK